MNDLIGSNGINFNVNLNKQDLVVAGLILFGAAVLAGVTIILFNRAVR